MANTVKMNMHPEWNENNSEINIKYLYALKVKCYTNASQNIARIAQCTCKEELQRKCKACKYIKEKNEI